MSGLTIANVEEVLQVAVNMMADRTGGSGLVELTLDDIKDAKESVVTSDVLRHPQ
jgi:hypothetical protein